jgi:hypothetical protein
LESGASEKNLYGELMAEKCNYSHALHKRLVIAILVASSTLASIFTAIAFDTASWQLLAA